VARLARVSHYPYRKRAVLCGISRVAESDFRQSQGGRPTTTECNARQLDFQGLGSRVVTARFDGGAISSDAGGLLLREVDGKTGILRRFAACFIDHRDSKRIDHSVYELLAQRVFALALGYDDLNDHDTFRHDPLLAVLVGKADPTGQVCRRPERIGQSNKTKDPSPETQATGLSAWTGEYARQDSNLQPAD
jgi:hypothetical protein